MPAAIPADRGDETALALPRRANQMTTDHEGAGPDLGSSTDFLLNAEISLLNEFFEFIAVDFLLHVSTSFLE